MSEQTVDGGDLGCGELLLLVRRATRDALPGTRVTICTRDAGAPVEIPAWCRLVGHRYVGPSGTGSYVVELAGGPPVTPSPSAPSRSLEVSP